MHEKYFGISLYDYATPSCCSFDKPYFGDMADLKAFQENLKSDLKLQNCLKQFISGNIEVMHTLYFSEQRFGKKVQFFGKKEYVVDMPYKWSHKNIWGFDYIMRFSRCESEHIWIKAGKYYFRCIKPTFYDLTYLNELTTNYDEITHFWGQPDYFLHKNNMLKALLYVTEAKFNTKEEMLQDMESFTVDKSCYEEVINEVFGDG